MYSFISRAHAHATERGWFVKIVPDEADTVGLEIGLGGVAVRNTRRPWFTWHKGEATEYVVPTELRHARKLWLQGRSFEKPGNDHPNVHLEMWFNDHRVKKLTFDDVEYQERVCDEHDD